MYPVGFFGGQEEKGGKQKSCFSTTTSIHDNIRHRRHESGS
jgi:hypothetical protein